jgi:CRP-like cAMP-binding protein
MSERVIGVPSATGQTADFLATVPLLEGIPEVELLELARVMGRRERRAGEVLFREGDDAQAMLLVVDGRVSVTMRLPGDRTVEIASMGRGEVLGEIPLLDAGRHPTAARVTEAATLLSLGRADFAALVSRRHPTSFTLKRRIAAVACTRLRLQLTALAASLGDARARPRDRAPGPAADVADLEYCRPPDSGYVRRLATFRAFDSLALWGFLTAGRFARCPAGRAVVTEGTMSPACYLTINGAVEKVIVRGGRRIRVGLAGPGQAFGYEGLIDGEPSPVTATTRERTLMLVLPKDAFERLFGGEESGSHVFLDVIHRDLMAALRQALRPHARLAASV